MTFQDRCIANVLLEYCIEPLNHINNSSAVFSAVEEGFVTHLGDCG